MLITLTTAQDVSNFLGLGGGLPTGSLDVEISEEFVFPESCRPVVPAIDGDPAREVNAIRVKIRAYDDGEVDVTATIYGYPLTKAGKRSQSAGHGAAYIGHADEVRWNLRRAAMLKALDNHDLLVEQVTYSRRELLTWDEMVVAKRKEMQEEAEAWAASKAAREAAILAAEVVS